MNTKKDIRLYKGIYYSVFFPFVFGCACLVTWPDSMLYVISGLLLNFLLAVLSYVFKWEKYLGWRIYFGIIQFDLSCIFTLMATWYRWGSMWEIGVGMVGCFLICKIIGYKFRGIILKEAINPKTVIGKIIYGLGFLGGGTAGFAGHFLNTELQGRYGEHVGGGIVLGILSVGLLLLSMFFQATHYKIDHPNFDAFGKGNPKFNGF
ncbi:hypothetical protein CN288_13020 [Bacillus sp. AFS023182]|nr:hypothetical protein CN288_13020 [Bacillus sp. AFS023182]